MDGFGEGFVLKPTNLGDITIQCSIDQVLATLLKVVR